ncbi:MAG: type II toxin-antitoxin system Phd/YefM family antitoxin [Alphaproteobacteria bacterium]|nr:type II toxin-antitoxin system Phd/YefM family antitoxin [Alphaproteobacteria bacterium]
MKSVAAKQAKDEFGRLLDLARSEPVRIEKHGRPVAVVLSTEEYERLEAIEDAWWALRAQAAGGEGFLGADASEALLRRLAHAPD